MAGAEWVVVFAAVVSGQFPKTLDAAGRTILFKAGSTGRFDCQKYFGGAKSALGGTYYEQRLMREETFSGPWLEVWTLTILTQKAAFCGTECSR